MKSELAHNLLATMKRQKRSTRRNRKPDGQHADSSRNTSRVWKGRVQERWLSYDNLRPSESIHDTWILGFFHNRISHNRLVQNAGRRPYGNLICRKTTFLESIKDKYDSLHKDPDVLDSNINSMKDQWKRLRILLAILALRCLESDSIISGLKGIEDNAPGNWAKNDEKLSSSLSVGLFQTKNFSAFYVNGSQHSQPLSKSLLREQRYRH